MPDEAAGSLQSRPSDVWYVILYPGRAPQNLSSMPQLNFSSVLCMLRAAQVSGLEAGSAKLGIALFKVRNHVDGFFDLCTWLVYSATAYLR